MILKTIDRLSNFYIDERWRDGNRTEWLADTENELDD